MEQVKKLKIIYMGTPDFSATLLSYLIKEGFNIIGVVTKEDAFVGRKKVLTPSPVKEVALKHNIPVFTPHRIRLDYEFILNKEPDLILTFAYGQIVPTAVIEAPKYLCLNFHGSLLPAYRGASPIQMALINGEKETGVTLMEMVDKMDAGRMFATESFALHADDNFKSVSEKMVTASIKLIENALPSIVSGENKGVTQDENLVTFAPILKAKDEDLDLENDDIKRVLGKIQAFAPHIGVNVLYENTPLKIYKAQYYSDETIHPLGHLFELNNMLLLQVKGGIISLLLVQKSGKNIIDAKSFLNGERRKLPQLIISRKNNA